VLYRFVGTAGLSIALTRNSKAERQNSVGNLFNNAVDWKCRSGSAQLDCRFVFESRLPPEAVLSAGFADGSSWGFRQVSRQNTRNPQ
jgi:hypothetical protein